LFLFLKRTSARLAGKQEPGADAVKFKAMLEQAALEQQRSPP
jgi:hypothetical protein